MKSPKIQTFAVLAAIGLAYVVLQIPLANNYALQFFALSILLFFVIKRLKNTEIWHHVKQNQGSMHLEMSVISFAILVLIGNTGNLNSPVLFLTYIHLFLLAMTTRPMTAISSTVAVMIFHFALSPVLNTAEIINLFSLPLLLTFFLFAKKQYDNLQISKAKLELERANTDAQLNTVGDLTSFIDDFLKPKLMIIVNLSQKKESTLAETIAQISLLESETNKVLQNLGNQKNSDFSADSQDQLKQQPGE